MIQVELYRLIRRYDSSVFVSPVSCGLGPEVTMRFHLSYDRSLSHLPIDPRSWGILYSGSPGLSHGPLVMRYRSVPDHPLMR